jgi:hypothetical protein
LRFRLEYRAGARISACEKRSLDLSGVGDPLTKTVIVSSGIGNIVLDYLVDLGKFQAELALRADCKDLAERVFARCEALVETLALEMDFQKESLEAENPSESDGV